MFGREPGLEKLSEQSSRFCSPLIAFASPGIPNERETKAASEALSQPANGYLLTIQGNCSHGRAFTDET